MRTALRAAAVLGFATLALGGQAKAVQNFTVGQALQPGFTVTDGDKELSNFAITGEVEADDEFSFAELPGNVHQLNLNFLANGNTPSKNGSMTYTITVKAPSTNVISQVALDADCGPLGKQNCLRSLTTTSAMTPNTISLASNVAAFTPAVTFTTATSTWAGITNADWVNNVSDKWVQTAAVDTVPGPLPILGAGLAFGYSRRLRARIKKAAI
ncbi:MAG: hypothetical protein ACK55H_03380 [Cyanobacteriota bacterium]